MSDVGNLLSQEAITQQLAIARQYYEKKQFAEAERICHQLIQQRAKDQHPACPPEHATAPHPSTDIEIRMLLGMALHQQKKLTAAQHCYECIIQLQPDHAAAYNNLALIFKAKGQYEQAIHWLERAIATNPDAHAAYTNLGNIFKQQGNLKQAHTAYQQALDRAPHDLDIRLNLGIVLRTQGDLNGAIAQYQDILKRDPSFVDAHNELGNLLQTCKQFEDAIQCYQAGLKHAPTSATLYNNLGAAFQELGCNDEAIAAYHHALKHRPVYADAYYNLGNALRPLDRLEEAIVAYRKALILNPNAAEVYNNLGLVLHDQGKLREAIAAYYHALALDPDYPDAHLNLGLSLLMDGDLAEGFREYEWRWQVSGRDFKPPRTFSQPLWDGRDLPQQTLFIYAEQGLGDTLQFIRYIPLLAECVSRIIVECQPPLVTLLNSIPGIHHIIPTGDPTPDFDTHIPLMSLPHILGTTLADLPSHTPYLTSSTPHSSYSSLPHSSTPSSPKIGLVWAGSPTHRKDRHRSCPFKHVAQLLDFPNVTFYSLQKGECEADLTPYVEKVINLSPHLHDFADTAAAIAQLDLVITVDTSVAHLAGALGKPVWIMLGFAYDWRWLRDRTDSPWYPTARLFHQPTPGNWAGLFDQVIQALQDCIDNNQPFVSSEYQRRANQALANGSTTALEPAMADCITHVQQSVQHKKWDIAIAQCQEILIHDPEQPQALETLGNIAYQQRRYPEAIAHFEQLYAAHATQPSVWSQLGNAYLHCGQADIALRWYRDYLAQYPDDVHVRNNVGVALRASGRDAEAIAHYRLILERDSQSADTAFNLANALRDRGQLEKAVPYYRKALTHRPDNADAWNNLANTLKDLNQIDEAIACYRKTLALMPNHASAHHNLGYSLLLNGDLRQGFTEYEWRWRVKNFMAPRTYSQPLWDGSDLHGKTILIYTEQGFGDTIQFIRYISLAAERGGHILVECRQPLVRLLRTIPAIKAIALRGDPLPSFDVYAPLMSLPHILGTTLHTIPAQTPYLFPASLTPHPSPPYSPSLPLTPSLSLTLPHSPTSPPLKIGITWAGSPTHKNDHNRSCPFANFWKLLRTPNTQFFSLQKGPRSTDITDYYSDEWPLVDLSDRLQDFADTAEAIAQLDLVITVDTSVAHLAGALGKPVWIVLPYAPDWRWMLDRDDSPWYPTAQLFRQKHPGDWADVFTRIKTVLHHQINTTPLITGPPPHHIPTSSPSPTGSHSHAIGIGIELSTSTGWGVFGTNLTLQLLRSKRWTPVPLLPPLAGSQFNPLHRTLLAPLLQIQKSIEHALAQQPEQSLTLPYVVLKALGNHFVTTPTLERIRGHRNIGLIFFEDAAITPQDIDKAKSYDLIIAGSSWNAEVLQSHGLQNVETVCQGIDPTLFHPAPRSGVLGDRFVIFSGGKLEYRKGQDIVIEAFRLFQQRHPDALLLTAWHNIWPQTIRSIETSDYVKALPRLDTHGRLQISSWLIENGIPADAVLDLGAIANSLIGQMVREADVALFPNRCEGGTNLAAMECLACGVPTILSANTGHLDLIRDGVGYALEVQHSMESPSDNVSWQGWGESDIDEILTFLEWIYTHRDQARAKARHDASRMQRWTWEAQVNRLMTLLGDRQLLRSVHNVNSG